MQRLLNRSCISEPDITAQLTPQQDHNHLRNVQVEVLPIRQQRKGLLIHHKKVMLRQDYLLEERSR